MVKVKLSQCYRGGVRKKGDTDPFNHSSTGVRSVVSLIQEYCKAQIHRCFGSGRHWSQSAWVKIHFTLLALNQKQLKKWMTNPRIELFSPCIFFTRCNNFEHCFKIFLKSTECFSKVAICNFFFIARTFIN